MTNKQLKNLKDTLWTTADQLRANSGLKSTEYAEPILGLIFLRFADVKYSKFEPEIKAEFDTIKGTRMERPIHEIAIEKCGFYLPEEARYDWLLNLPESEDLAKKVKEAMEAVEKYTAELEDTLDLLRKEHLTADEEKRVKLAAKELYNTLTEKRNELFIVGWQNDPQPKERVKGEIVYILNKFLPESYDREIFLRKSTLVFDHIVDQAMTGYNWVA